MTLKNIWLLAIGAALILLGYCAGAVQIAHSQQAPAGPQLTDRQSIWLDSLIWCESRGIASAINPKDRDGTPSYGYLQFKPSTLAYFEKAYDITGDLMSSSTQKAIVTQMILHKGIDWHQQFPDCVRKLGTPPTN